ncbi:ABC transporter ATP-binding protein [Streptomyces sp. NBC_00690]|uniref:ABC transporter ATP-binding protein n=1 Tax=Streptomyces sp. NBC_00690 TaxID=2975808 RepID=UPI002E2A3195|nr:ATP-binding cassette domain-containing protein [Streptomyces sp. NBC_00690]
MTRIRAESEQPTTEPLVRVTDLEVHSPNGPVLHTVHLSMAPGESIAVVGASGSGKTTLALAVLGLLRPGLVHRGGQVTVAGRPSLPEPPSGLRGRIASYVGQDAGAALNPYQRLGRTVRTALGGGHGNEREVDAVLCRAGLDPSLGDRRPAELSGGQQQRGSLAVALARAPQLLVLDEPTSALDASARAEVRTELARLRSTGVALLWITHDLASVQGLVDRLVVLDDGRVVEDRPAHEVLSSPRSPAARRLVAAHREPTTRSGVESPAQPLLHVTGLRCAHGSRRVFDAVDLAVRPGHCLAVTGASGSGKSTLARCIAGLHPPDRGAVLLDGRALAAKARRRPTADRAAVQLVPQSPLETLHPGHTIGAALTRPLRLLRGMRDPEQIEAESARLLALVHLAPDLLRRAPAELSGGQRQRAAIARALAAAPRVLLCDEMTSALDSVNRASVLDLLDELRERESLALLVVTHDPQVIGRIADEVVELADGSIGRARPPRVSRSPNARRRPPV